MRIINIRLFAVLLLLFTSHNALYASDTALKGLWKGEKIQLHLKADKTYNYKINVLSFAGKWSTNNNVLTLSYSILGVKKDKTAKYSFDNNDLLLEQDGKKSIRLVKVR